jgi:hypothetical protein
MSSWDRFNQKTFPKYEQFSNRLNGYYNKHGEFIPEQIEYKDYLRGKLIWKKAQCKNLGDYHDLYLKTDVLLLADIFERFRDQSLKTYGLDPAWYFTLPGLAWDAMLKITKIDLELLTDYDMLLMFEKAKRGGLSQCNKRYAKSNNKYMKDYNPNNPSCYLLDLDANNLYGWAMTKYLPYAGFKWSNADYDKIITTDDDADTGYLLEVDLEYPMELHNLHKDYSLAPENRKPPGSKDSKLLATLYNKEKYVLHYKNLKLYVQLGLKVTKVHRVIEFKQADWLKKYIDLNTELRTKASTNFEKDFYKLMNNSVFGKTMENIRHRVDVRLVTDGDKYERLIAKPTYNYTTYFGGEETDENYELAAVHIHKREYTFNKPIYVGVCILEISKIRMYDFHYNVMKKKYGQNIEYMYGDTDSLKYLIFTDDVYEDMKTIIDELDTSDYSKDNKYGIPQVNKKVLGKMKDENNGNIFNEFVGLKSKNYCQDVEGKEKKTAKGIKKCVTENTITMQDFKDCLFNKQEQYRRMNLIRSEKHELYTVELNKIALSPHDDKRYILEDGINTLPWGHYKIKQLSQVV